jgi:spore germination protein KA
MKKELQDSQVRGVFTQAADFVARDLRCAGQDIHLYMIDGLVAITSVSEQVVRPLSYCGERSMEQLYDFALRGGVYNVAAAKCDTLEDCVTKLLSGNCVVLFPGCGAVSYEVKSPEKRSPSPPEVEGTVKGPKDAFTETMRTNTYLVRRHMPARELCFWQTQVGTCAGTGVTVAWLDGRAEPDMVKAMQQRLSSLAPEGLLTPAAVEELITGSRVTAFPLLAYTERADRFCQGLLRGRVGILVDGLPLGYLAPADLGFLMESPEDEGVDYLSASCIRVLRYGALLLSLLLPGVFVALATFHQEMIPLPLLRSIIQSKEAVPFSTGVEVLGLLLAFELLQESGIHLPRSMGQSVSLIGGIVVGTAAVEASLISPAALIAVSIAGVCGFTQPNRDLAEAVRLWRFGLCVLAIVGGLFAVTAGFCALLVHLSGLTCLGRAYLLPFSRGSGADILRRRVLHQKKGEP